MKMKRLLLCLLIAVTARSSHAHPEGPPVVQRVCEDLKPGTPHGDLVQIGNGGYTIITDLPASTSSDTGFDYRAGMQYTVILDGAADAFRGFLIQSRSVPGDMLVGSFSTTSVSQQILPCQDAMGNPTQATLSHRNPERAVFSQQVFTWQAPAEADGTVEIFFTVVQTRPVFFTKMSASANFIFRPDLGLALPKLTTAYTNTQVIEAESHDLIFTVPANCEQSACDVHVRVYKDSNDSSIINFELEGKAAAWVAVGFSETPNMWSTKAFVCNFNPNTSMIEALDTWNAPKGRKNTPDEDQSYITLLTGSFTDGRIFCNFTRKVNSPNFTLNAEYYALYGRSNNKPLPGRLVGHVGVGMPNPTVSAKKLNPVKDTGVVAGNSFEKVEQILIQTHGVLMLVAWPLLASTGMFFAAWMRPALPNGEWFQVHRAFMVASLFLGAAGFVLIFVGQIHNPTPGLINLGSAYKIRTTHFVFGIAIMTLQILNPLLALLRCKPESKNRWIYNYLHGFMVGRLAEALTYTNAALGITIFLEKYPPFSESRVPLWLYIAYVGFVCVFTVILIPLNTKATKYVFGLFGSDGDDSELMKLNPTDSEGEVGRGKIPSKDSYLRWIALTVFLGVSVPAIVALIVLICL